METDPIDIRLFQEICRSWEGTPHKHGKMERKVGVDCANLPVAIVNEYSERKGYSLRVEIPRGLLMRYDRSFFMRIQGSNNPVLVDFVRGLEKSGKVKFREKGSHPLPGDILFFKRGDNPGAHMGVMYSEDKIIHSEMPSGLGTRIVPFSCVPGFSSCFYILYK